MAEAVAKLFEGVVESVELSGQAGIDETWKDLDARSLSYKVASALPVGEDAKQEILEIPDPAARPRRIALTSDDIVWFTDHARGYLGRLDPATGAVTEFASPGGPRSRPYGIASVHDVLFYNESGVEPNTIVRFDPRTQKSQTWTIPSGGGVVRNMSVTPDGNIALACSGVNKVGLVEVTP